MKYLFFAMLLFLSTALLAQSGNFFLSHYAPGNKAFDNVCFDIVQDQRGVFYFASPSGVLEFDGRNWDLIQGSGSIFSLRIAASGSIYWSGTQGFGKITINDHGKAILQQLSDEKAKDIFQSVNIQNQVYFLSEHHVFVLDESTSGIKAIPATNFTGSFTGIVEILGRPHISTVRGEIYSIVEEKLSRTNLGLDPGTAIVSSIQLDNKFLVVTNYNGVVLFEEGLQPRFIHLQDSAYAIANVITSAVWVNKQLIALGTLRGGVLFVNPYSGETQEIVSYSTGLPDNEVFALMSDRNQNVWVAHDYGFTRIAPYLPLRSFSHYPGLQGNILCASSFRNTVYVGTTLGLFKLQREDFYEEMVYYVDVEVKDKKGALSKGTPLAKDQTEISTAVPEVESKKKGFFNFLKRKKEKTDVADKKDLPDSKDQHDTSEVPAQKESTSPVFRKEKRTQRILRSSQYVYKKIPGIEAKVTQLTIVGTKLVATGLAGAYDVDGLQAKAIVEQPVRFAFFSQAHNMFLLSTYENEILTVEHVDRRWQFLNIFNNLDDQINFIFEGKQKELWLCSLDKVYRLEVDNRTVLNIQAMNLPGSLQKVVGIEWNGSILMANAAGFYRFDRSSNTFNQIDSLPAPQFYFASKENVWYRDDHQWHNIGQSTQSNLQLLNLFNDLRFIASDDATENLWLVSSNNELFKFFGEKISPYESGYEVILKSIRMGDQQLAGLNQMEIDQHGSILSFAVVQPDYVNPLAVEYRYFLKGLHQNWTDWSSANNTFDFPYLPAGNYTLEVQAKNIFGKITSAESLTFEVQPPYWKRSWFYALEFAVFASLVILSFRLSNRYRIVSRLLSLLTIILLIEFIQTVIGATFAAKDSPVSDFFIQVVVALLILPVEGYLRNLMLRSIDPSKKWYQLMMPGSKMNPPLGENKDQ